MAVTAASLHNSLQSALIRTPAARSPAQQRRPRFPAEPDFSARLLAADLLQRELTALIVQLLEPIEAVAAVAHQLAGLADIAELLGKLQQSDFGSPVMVSSNRRDGRFATPTAPRPTGLRFAVNRCQIKS
jgi:hypothetical protein